MDHGQRLRLAADTGGTFTDLVVEGGAQGLRFFKRPTTPDNPIEGLLDVIGAAGQTFDASPRSLLARVDLFVFGTTRATNAIVTGATAQTALLTTKGHPDILLFREGGGRTSLFDYEQEYPDPYIPRSLTVEVPERIGADGAVITPLDEESVRSSLQGLASRGVEAVAVSLLWSIVNPDHELRMGELIRQHLPEVPFTLSHQLNPSLREYRRTSSTAIDASLKPVMSRFFSDLEQRLRSEGFSGRLLIMTAAGGVLDASTVAEAPIHSIGSGPAAAPVAGRHFAQVDASADTAIVTDAGGTTFDVSLLRRGQIPWTRETIVGHPTYGFITGFPSVDVKSVGAGGGSVAWVDSGGLLHVGPESAGADPGPASYGRGGTKPTVTDACVVLGYLDPDYFLGGEMQLRVDLATEVITRDVATPLGLALDEAAAAVLNLATERMVQAIEEITLNQGIDSASGPLIGGGGGAGLYAVQLARRLSSPVVVIPEVSAALSAFGALLSDLRQDYSINEVMSTDAFDYDRARGVLAQLQRLCDAFIADSGTSAVATECLFSVEARYPHQVWEIEVPLRTTEFNSPNQVEQLRQDFHATHRELYAISDDDSEVEVVAWRAQVRCSLRAVEMSTQATVNADAEAVVRDAYFSGLGRVQATVRKLVSVAPGERLAGPAILESPVTTIVIDPDAYAERLQSGSLLIFPTGAEARRPPAVEAGAALEQAEPGHP